MSEWDEAEAAYQEYLLQCPWCTMPVKEQGDTCGYQCYTSWLVALHLGNGIVPPKATVPKDLHLQPWYRPKLGERNED